MPANQTTSERGDRTETTGLVEDCIAGQSGAWKRFVARYAPLIAVVARRTLRARTLSPSQEDIEDICENTFYAILKDDFYLLKSYDDQYALSTFLGVVARTQAGRYVRRKKHRTCDIENVDVTSSYKDPALAVEERDLERMLHETIESLSERDRQILRLFYFSNQDYQSIARTLGVRPNSVGAALHRARERLKKRLLEKQRGVA